VSVAVVGRITTTLALALCLFGCGSTAPSGEPVQLLTGIPLAPDECAPWGNVGGGVLVVDPKYGTAIAGSGGQRTPVMWPIDFTGRLVGSEVAVVDIDDNLVATTGQSYSITGSYLPQFGEGVIGRRSVPSPIGVDMLYACGRIRAEPTAVPMDEFVEQLLRAQLRRS
jgi:hypothetical protein